MNAIRTEASKSEITVHRLRGGISVLMGSGGNIGVLPGLDGTLLVDAGIAVSRHKITRVLDDSGAAPAKHVINTHWHFDHTDGNAWLHQAGATIIAHENTRTHMAKATRVEGWSHTFPASSTAALPSNLVRTERTLRLNGATLSVKPYGRAHTDSDLSVAFTEADVLHTGDTWWNGFYPFIDYSTGGHIDGTLRAAEANIAAVTARTIVIPGHGPVGGKAQLIEFRDMLASIRDSVAALKKQGRSQEEVVAAKPTRMYDAKWGGFAIDGDAFAGLVYAGV